MAQTFDKVKRLLLLPILPFDLLAKIMYKLRLASGLLLVLRHIMLRFELVHGLDHGDLVAPIIVQKVRIGHFPLHYHVEHVGVVRPFGTSHRIEHILQALFRHVDNAPILAVREEDEVLRQAEVCSGHFLHVAESLGQIAVVHFERLAPILHDKDGPVLAVQDHPASINTS